MNTVPRSATTISVRSVQAVVPANVKYASKVLKRMILTTFAPVNMLITIWLRMGKAAKHAMIDAMGVVDLPFMNAIAVTLAIFQLQIRIYAALEFVV